jgi:hypothetical protein
LTARAGADNLENTPPEISFNPNIIRENYIARKYDPATTALALPERISQAAFGGSDGGNLREALSVGEGSLRSVRPPQSGSAEARETFRKEVHAAEQKDYLTRAKANDQFIDEAAFNARWEADGRRGESEHQVYRDAATGRYWKRNTLNFHDGSISSNQIRPPVLEPPRSFSFRLPSLVLG